SVASAIPMGVLAAWKAGMWVDRLVMGFPGIGILGPGFVLAYLFIYFFAISNDLFPVQGFVRIRDRFWPFPAPIPMPHMAVGMIFAALIARMTRASMLDVLAQDYIRTAQAKGLSNDKVLIGHALKNAAVPIATIIGVSFALLISGVVVTETVFAIPGLGRLT